MTVKEQRDTVYFAVLTHVFFSRSSTLYMCFEGFINDGRNDNGVHVTAFGLLMGKGAMVGAGDQITFLECMTAGKKVKAQ